MSAPPAILDLVVRFGQQLDTYKSGAYNETQLRRDFLDPLFKALGWDMDNEAGYAEAYRDVIHEDAIRIGGAVKAPDYCFRIGGTRKFFLEAKKPSVFIKQEIPSAYQLRRYGWSAKLPLSILSDFEELAVYDCRVKPGKDDPASTARVFYCTFRELAEKWDWLASIFSRDAVLKGSFDKFAETNKAKRGTTEVDADFLASMETWRNDLAKNLALRNPRLSQRELNFAVQRILDRIIFLRICEDRGLEDYGRLQALTNADRIYPRLCQHFEQPDTRYNSGIFHFKPEKDRHEPPDELTLGLDVDDALLRDLLKGLYYPDSPYEFSVLSADILGQVYEQFLGKVIRLTEGHRAVVDEKPEVRKAGGVYYTPTYVADYIVRQTVGRLLEECSSRRKEAHSENPEKEVSLLTSAATNGSTNPRAAQRILDRVAQLRILDPACGSGSFLICAYQFLLDWHLPFYLQLLDDPESGRSRGDETQTEKPGNKVSLLTSAPTVVQRVHWLLRGKNPPIVQTTRGWRLTIAERKRILLNNIYGVDIDPQAVEVTKLSLLLKVLEGETSQSIAPLFSMFHERALPDLGDNIKCGNSLIGPDFYGGRDELPLFPEQKSGTRSNASLPLTGEEKLRLNVFDWHAEFPHIFRRRNLTGELCETASPLDCMMPGVPLHGSYSYKKKKTEKTALPPTPMESEWEGGFDAVIGNPPYIFTREQMTAAERIYYADHFKLSWEKHNTFMLFMEAMMQLLNSSGRGGFIVPNSWLTIESGKLLRDAIISRLLLIADLNYPAFDKVSMEPSIFVIGGTKHDGDVLTLRVNSCEEFISAQPSFTDRRKWQDASGRIVLSTANGLDRIWACVRNNSRPLGDVFEVKTGLQAYEKGRGNPPQSARDVKEHVFDFSHRVDNTTIRYLEGKDVGRFSLTWSGMWMRYGPWLSQPRELGMFTRPRVLLREITAPLPHCLHAVLTTEQFLNNKSVLNILHPANDLGALKALVCVLNSSLVSVHYKNFAVKAARTIFPKVVIKNLREFPYPKGGATDLPSLADRMLSLHHQLASARTPHEQTALERQIAYTETQIDRLVYQLYGLSQEEITIVEQG